MISVRIETERLLLREFVQADWKSVHEYASDPEVVKYDTWGPNTEDQSHDFIFRVIMLQSERPRRNFELAVTDKSDGTLVGACRIGMKSEQDRDADIGYVLRRDRWGLGLGTEIAQALVRHGFHALGLNRIWATCDVRNAASARVLEKAGMRREGHLRQNKLQRGVFRDSFLYAILNGSSAEDPA